MFDYRHFVPFLIFCMCCLVTVYAYFQGLYGPWLLDDLNNIPQVFLKDVSFKALSQMLLLNESGPLGRPVSQISFYLTYITHGEGPFGFKLHSLIIHLICGGLIYLLLMLTLGASSLRLTLSQSQLICVAVSAIWLLHPLQVSTVLYPVQRMAQLATLFTLIALIIFLYGRRYCLDRPFVARCLLFIAFPIALGLAVLSKESGALILLFIAVLELTILNQKNHDLIENATWRFFILLWVVLPLLAGIALVGLRFDSFFNYSGRDFTLLERGMTQVQVVFDYILVILLPDLSRMTLFHDGYPPVVQVDGVILIKAAALLGLFTAAIVIRRKLPLASFGVLWFFAAHVLESTIFPLELVFEHRNYLAMLGPVLMLVYLLVATLKQRIAAVIIVGLVLFYSGFTLMRVDGWVDEREIYQRALIDHPRSNRARTSYFEMLVVDGKIDEAFEQLILGRQHRPDEVAYSLNTILLSCVIKRTITKDIKKEVKEKLINFDLSSFGKYAILSFYDVFKEGKCAASGLLLEEFIEFLTIAISRSENGPTVRKTQVALLYHNRGQLYFLLNNFPQAFKDMDKSYSIHPYPQFLFSKINAALALGLVEVAQLSLTDLKQASNDNPELAVRIIEIQKRIEQSR